MKDCCGESMTCGDTYKIQNETTRNHDHVNFYQASQTLYCTAEDKNKPTEIPSQMHLVICQTCYWCATFLKLGLKLGQKLLVKPSKLTRKLKLGDWDIGVAIDRSASTLTR